MFLEAVLFRSFERLLNPFPPEAPSVPPNRLLPFLWACPHGSRRYIALLALLSASVSIYEAWLFAFLGQVVDFLSA
jgi:ATP-binding cassette subfamily B multidrug efflux pump